MTTAKIFINMKLLKTIKKLIEESERQYNSACENCAPIEEIDKLEKHYKDSLRLLNLYNKTEKKLPSSHTNSRIRK